MINATYEYKLEVSTEQAKIFDHWLEVCRTVWNYGLRERKDWHNSRSCPVNACSIKSEYIIPAHTPQPNYTTQSRALTEARTHNPDLQTVHLQVLHQVLRQLEKVFTAMAGSGFGFPKRCGQMKTLLLMTPHKTVIRDNGIDLPSLGTLRFEYARPLPDGFGVKQLRILKRLSGFFVML